MAYLYGKGLRLSSIVLPLCLAKTLPHDRRPGSSVLPPRVVCTGQDRCANLSSAQATGDSSTTMSPFLKNPKLGVHFMETRFENEGGLALPRSRLAVELAVRIAA